MANETTNTTGTKTGILRNGLPAVVTSKNTEIIILDSDAEDSVDKTSNNSSSRKFGTSTHARETRAPDDPTHKDTEIIVLDSDSDDSENVFYSSRLQAPVQSALQTHSHTSLVNNTSVTSSSPSPPLSPLLASPTSSLLLPISKPRAPAEPMPSLPQYVLSATKTDQSRTLPLAQTDNQPASAPLFAPQQILTSEETIAEAVAVAAERLIPGLPYFTPSKMVISDTWPGCCSSSPLTKLGLSCSYLDALSSKEHSSPLMSSMISPEPSPMPRSFASPPLQQQPSDNQWTDNKHGWPIGSASPVRDLSPTHHRVARRKTTCVARKSAGLGRPKPQPTDFRLAELRKSGDSSKMTFKPKVPVRSPDKQHRGEPVMDFTAMPEWRAKTPFGYQFFYSQKPPAEEVFGSHCLSMTWCPSKKRGRLDLHMVQGNGSSMDVINNWKFQRQLSDSSKSLIVQCPIDFPARSPAECMQTPVDIFKSSEVNKVLAVANKDDQACPVVSLKLHDHGRILFACSMNNIMVIDAASYKQKATLVLLDDIDGIFDVGRDYVVANSMHGEVGVWKAGSPNYMWRYNDTRRFHNAQKDGAMNMSITALKIAPNDACVYVGDSSKGLSMIDFRLPFINRLSTPHRGIIHSIETMDSRGIMVGTSDGYIEQMDTRFVGGNKAVNFINRFKVPASSIANRIRVCPHDPKVFSCSSGSNVHIYQIRPESQKIPLFTHQAHRTTVSGFEWHPEWEYRYTIGSSETGEGNGVGYVQIWRPSSVLMNSFN